jgi:Zn-dependent protease with chaperone function
MTIAARSALLGACLSGWAVLAGAVAAPAGPPEPGINGMVSLDLTFDRQGDADVFLWATGDAANPETVRRLGALIPCRLEGPPEAEEDEDGRSLAGTCRGALRSDGGLRSGRLDFGPIAEAVAAIPGVDFEPGVTIPRAGTARCPGWNRTLGYFSDVNCSGSLLGGVHRPPAAVDIAYGFRTVDLAWRFGLLALLALVPPVLLLRRRKAVLAARGDERMTAWFGYWRLYRGSFQGIGFLWIALFYTLRLQDWATLEVPSIAGRLALELLLLAGPPCALFLIGQWLSRPVIAHVREMSRPASEMNREAVGYVLSGVLPIALLVLGLTADVGAPAMTALLLLSFAIGIGGRLIVVQATRLFPQALTTGGLRDRVFEMAREGKVKLNQVYVLPASRMRLANAFATSGQNVLLTDYLLAQLSRRETEAVVAHELSHLRSRHPVKLMVVLWLVIFGATLGLSQGGPWSLYFLRSWLARPELLDLVIAVSPWPLLLLAAFLPFRLFSRRIERSADAGAAKLTGDPEAMISALGKLARLNLLPLRWGKLTETLSTHPAMERRAQALAKRFSIPPERAEALLRGDAVSGGPAGAEEPSWELPATDVAEERIYTTRLKTRVQLRIAWTTLVSTLGMTVAAALAVHRVPLHGLAILWAFGSAGVLAVIGGLLTANLLGTSGHAEMRRELAERLRREGIDAEGQGGVFGGFAPHGEPRLYEGHTSWDIGFVLTGRDSLVWLGDRIRFRLTRREIEGVRLGPGVPSFWRGPSLYVDWRGEDGRLRTFYLRASASTLRGVGRETRKLAARLETWWRVGPSTAELHAALVELPPPITSEVTGVDPRTALKLKNLLATAWLYGFLALSVCTLFGLVTEGFLAAVTAILVMFFLMLPSLLARLRRRRPSAAPATSSPSPEPGA